MVTNENSQFDQLKKIVENLYGHNATWFNDTFDHSLKEFVDKLYEGLPKATQELIDNTFSQLTKDCQKEESLQNKCTCDNMSDSACNCNNNTRPKAATRQTCETDNTHMTTAQQLKAHFDDVEKSNKTKTFDTIRKYIIERLNPDNKDLHYNAASNVISLTISKSELKCLFDLRTDDIRNVLSSIAQSTGFSSITYLENQHTSYPNVSVHTMSLYFHF
jgi:hypothetical protein